MRVDTVVCEVSDSPWWTVSTWSPRQVLNVPFNSFSFASVPESDGCPRVHGVCANLGKQWPRELNPDVIGEFRDTSSGSSNSWVKTKRVTAMSKHMTTWSSITPAWFHCRSSPAHRVSGWLSLGSAKVDLEGLFGTLGEARQCRHAPRENCVSGERNVTEAAQLPSMCGRDIARHFQDQQSCDSDKE